MKNVKRLARVCPWTKGTERCNWRSFGDPEAVCPEHGKGIDQPDRPYQKFEAKRSAYGTRA